MDAKRTNLVAEIGCVHGGSLSRAIKLIDLAASSGADAVKSQKRHPYESVPENISTPKPKFFIWRYLLGSQVEIRVECSRSSRNVRPRSHAWSFVWLFCLGFDISQRDVFFIFRFCKDTKRIVY